MTIEKERFRKLVEQSREERQRVRHLVATRRWRQAEPDRDRMARFSERKLVRMAVPAGAEAIVGSTMDLQGASFLAEGAQIRRAVAYVEVNAPTFSQAGTGFMVSPQLFLTNRHVIPDANAARGTQITFDREMDELGRPRATTTFLLDPERFALFSKEEELDYALVAVGRLNVGTGQIADFAYCILSDRPDKHVIGMNVNIIQHPRAWPKMIAVRNNLLEYRTDRTLLYETDTDHGSSGSPVFNDDWDLIALHHWGEPFLEHSDEQGHALPTTINEGVRISAIYHDLEGKLAGLTADQQALLREALSFDKQQTAGTDEHVLSGPRPRPHGSESLGTSEKGMTMAGPDQNELRVTIPIEVVVRIGASGATAAVGAPVAAPTLAPARALIRAAEAVQVDQDYSNRHGFIRDFIPGAALDLPTPKPALAKQVAPLRAEEPAAEAGELKYVHFSLKMHKTKRIAVFTATNIDGETYLAIDRGTGQAAEAAEGDRWFKDPRISASFFLDQTFYAAWSQYFDRGHLTRRTDPTWGDADEAERANADTFHFTNCSPQHFRFNQTTRYWQGAERYVLENGLLHGESKKRICVYQGPIFDDGIDHWADDVQIPSSFFKVIVWRGANGLKSVGLIVDQLALLSETRKNLGQPHEVPGIDVSQWRVGIKTIEDRTQLDFGAAIRDADTIRRPDQPTVGEEAQVRVASFADLLPR
jgi:endonuclease G